MRRARHIIFGTALLFGLLVAACSPSGPDITTVRGQSSEAGRFPRLASQTLLRIQAAHLLLASPDVDSMSPAEQDERFRAVQNKIIDDMAAAQSLDVPEYLNESRHQLVRILLSEQHIWDHMALFALSGEEGQRAEARLESADVDLEAQTLASEMTRLLKARSPALAALIPIIESPPATAQEAASAAESSVTAAVPQVTPGYEDSATATVPRAAYGSGGGLPPAPNIEPASVPEGSVTATAPSYDSASPADSPAPAPDAPESGAPAIKIPDLTLSGGTGEIIILRYKDRQGNPAMVAHWSMDIDPGKLALIDYPFVSGDILEMSAFGHRIDLVYMESPSGERILELENFLRPWRGDITATEDGWYRIYLDNTNGDTTKNMHVIIKYHDEAPDAVHLPEGQNELMILLPLDGR